MNTKDTARHVLGGLLIKPQLLSQVDKYSLSIADFSTRFEKYIFLAIRGLYQNGATKIEAIDVSNFLSSDTVGAKLFETQGGVEYVQDAIDFSSVENFQYYYDKLKKLNLLRDLKKQGFDISEFYEDDLTKDSAAAVNEKFEQLTTKQICDQVRQKLITLETEYSVSEEVVVESASDGIESFIHNLNDTIDIGVPLQGHIYNKIIGGASRGKLTIRSGSSGLGKTRQAIADACYLAYPTRYNSSNGRWEQQGSSEKVLFIVTEQTIEEVKRMVLAYLSDINESRFKHGSFTEQEWDVLNKAIAIMQHFDNLIFVKMPNPTIDLVKTMVREQCLTKDIGYVFYDYIFIGPALLAEFRGFTLRNDEVLLMFATALKDLAVELDVAMFTSTQVNSAADDNKNIRNEASLSGGRSTINKADNGAIMARPSPEELETLQPIIAKHGTPNMVTDVFKVRGGEWTQVRVWSKVDLGRMRKQDLFLTDARLDPIEGFFDIDESFEIHNWTRQELSDIQEYIKELNN